MSSVSRFRLIAASALMMTVAASSAQGAETVLLSHDSRAAKARVTLQPAAKLSPELMRVIQDGADESFSRFFKDASDAYREAPGHFAEAAPRKYEFERSYKIESVTAKRYVSLTAVDYTDSLGAHPGIESVATLWDDHAKKAISALAFLQDPSPTGRALAAIGNVVKAQLRAEKKRRDNALEDDFDILEHAQIVLVASTEPGRSAGLSFQYGRNIGSYAEGFYDAFVPWTVFASYLTPEGKTVFGGKPLPLRGRPPRA